ncbi:MAG: DUF3579 domain-containing protein [Gallionellaceae bacterium]|nr:DUF3579 domain-containing protein [Gallionellaceae bacterium]
MLSAAAEFVIQGITLEGEVFQPVDWAERLCATLPPAPDQRVDYSSFVRPMMIGGVKSLIVRIALKEANTPAFNLIKQYIADHHLLVRAGRGSRDADPDRAKPPVAHERRDPNRNNW